MSRPASKAVPRSVRFASVPAAVAELGSVGTVNATSPSDALPRGSEKKLANPSPMGVFAFSITTLVLSLYNAQARGVTEPNVVVGMAIFVGGLVQFAAGMWEVAVGNTFGSTVFSLYGGFWMSYATILIPSSGILDAFAKVPDEIANALGIFLIAWFAVTFIFLIGTIKKTVAFIALFGALDITFLFLALSNFTGKVVLAKVGGYFGIITAVVGFYIGAAGVLEGDFHLPVGVIPRRLD